MSITPALILAAMIEHASNPEEHSLLMATMEVVSGNPAKNIAILFGISPAPGCKLLPTAMSWMSLGFTLARRATYLKTTDRRYSGAVSLSPPLLPLVIGVLTAAQITTSSSDLAEMSCLVMQFARFCSLCILTIDIMSYWVRFTCVKS